MATINCYSYLRYLFTVYAAGVYVFLLPLTLIAPATSLQKFFVMALSLPTTCSPFDPQLETVSEFFQRFQCQMSEHLHKHRNDDIKRASILLKFLPVPIISDLQRRLAPTLLQDATYDDIKDHLNQQYSTTKSTVGASVQFLTCKQQPGQSLEDYGRKLNNLASLCKYPADSLDRLSD